MSGVPQTLWDATCDMPSATRHAVRSVFARYDTVCRERAADRAALATLARAAVDAEKLLAFLIASHPPVRPHEDATEDLRAALALPAVRDVLATDRAASHSHAARATGEGDE